MRIKIPDKFAPMFKPKRIKVYFGGRGGAKTESFARVALTECAKGGKRFLCLREHMNSIEDSVHSTLKSIIDSDGFTPFFDIMANEVRGAAGGGFRYGQMARNLSSIKSKHDFDVAWVEEAETVSEESIEVLEPTIRKAGSELWYSFNPVREDGAVYSRYVKPHLDEILRNGFYEDDDLYVCKVGLEDNPWAPDELVRASEKLKADDYDKWVHIYGGEPMRDLEDVIIQPKWVEAAIDAHKALGWDGVGVRCMGFDPADGGGDAKAVALRHGSLVKHVKCWQKGDIEDATNRAFAYADDWRADDVVFDADGLGAAVKMGLDKRIEGKAVRVHAYHGGAGVDQPGEKYAELRSNKDTFKNKRAQYYWKLRDRFEATYRAVKKGEYLDPEKMISIDSEGVEDMALLKSELTNIKRKMTNNSVIQIESKVDMARRGVKSPNMADALVMAFANPAPSAEIQDVEFDSLW